MHRRSLVLVAGLVSALVALPDWRPLRQTVGRPRGLRGICPSRPADERRRVPSPVYDQVGGASVTAIRMPTRTSISTILDACDGDYLLMASGPSASAVVDVLCCRSCEPTSSPTPGTWNIPTDSNGTGWYFNGSLCVGLCCAR